MYIVIILFWSTSAGDAGIWSHAIHITPPNHGFMMKFTNKYILPAREVSSVGSDACFKVTSSRLTIETMFISMNLSLYSDSAM